MRLKILFAILTVCLIWGGVAVAIKVGLWDAPVFGFVAARFWLGGAALWLWARWRGASLTIPSALVPSLVRVAVFFTLLMVCVTWGTGMTAASRSSVFINTQPIQVAVLAHFLLPGDRLSPRKMAGLAVAFIGVLLVVLTARTDFAEAASWRKGDLVVLLAAFWWAVQTIYAKRIVVRISPLALTLWQVLLCAFVTTLLSLVLEPWAAWHVTGRLALALLYVSLGVTTVGWALWFYVLREVEASVATTFLFSIPILGVLAGWLLLNEPLGLNLLGGAILVGIGILLVTTPSGPRPAVAIPGDPPRLVSPP
ncbi:MAG: DMT family transporter [candidate division NC10 bacterium]|nr:DMT family transporter [candidate division NC10 bacterium]